jgi:sterol desaturase/sphingolipid hydroxylase (fatty acid hydroxylase superfamily)
MDAGHSLSGGASAEIAPMEMRPRWPLRELVLALALIALLTLAGLALAGDGRPLWIVLVVALFPILSVVAQSAIERLLPAAGPRKSLQSSLLHLQVNTFFAVASVAMSVAAFLGSAALTRQLGFELGLIDIRIATGQGLLVLVASIWLSSILGDFFFYWYHRWTHVNPFLWQHHKMHHTDRELEAISTARQNWIEAVFNALFIAVPMIVLFKVDPRDQWSAGLFAGLTAGVVNNLLTLSHMNVRLHTGWFARLWCGPQTHRIHHSLEPQHIDRNFAFVFPMWDILFGTYVHPKKGEFPATGVAGEDGFRTFWEAQIYTPREWLKYMRNKRGRARRANG